MSTTTAANGFTNYPPAQLASVPESAKTYTTPPQKNPTLKGLPLTLLSHVISAIGPLQTVLWKNAGFGVVAEVERSGGLERYEVNHDPTVLPVKAEGEGEGGYRIVAPERQDPSTKPVFYSAGDFIAAYKEGTTTPLVVAERILQLLENDAALRRIFITPTPREELLANARESTERYAAGTPRALEGVPFVVKDEVDVAGFPKTMGMAADVAAQRIGGPAEETTSSVKPFLEAGVLFLGKSSMHELGLDTTNNNPNWGTPPNPYNAGYYPGGSSGGSGAAVGAGLVPIAVGADGGGSIRVPASYCGVYGLKPTHGRIDISPTLSLAPSVGVVGPITATAKDLRLAYHAMSRTPPSPSPPSSEKLKFGIYKPWFDDCTPVVHNLVTAAIETLQNPIIQVPAFPYLSESRTAHAVTILNDIGNVFCRGDASGLTPANRVLISVSRKTTPADIAAAGKLRQLLMSHLSALWEEHPDMVIVTPTTPHSGVRIVPGTEVRGGAGVSDANSSLRSMQYVWMANWTGCPAVSVPVGYDEEGVPVGLMAMGRWGAEEALVALAERWERFRIVTVNAVPV
ncbi:amidase signature enzyme [Ascodesmis nigricans]|uniref:Amidase signature enzyme n=1 Tax=Ascodesmis nigricans TaxID=341454 RepID=A0A4S2MJL0_9PEZI|nr:amidase signature enzyme [Ascodesmis nigricans]